MDDIEVRRLREAIEYAEDHHALVRISIEDAKVLLSAYRRAPFVQPVLPRNRFILREKK